MNIELKQGFRFTSTVIRSLEEAGKFRTVRENDKIWCQGYAFKTPKAFGQFMIKELNDWQFGAGLYNIAPLKMETYQGQLCPFNITE